MFGTIEFNPDKERGGPSIHEQVEGMAAMIEAGRIRHYGLSNETTWGVCEFHRVARELGLPGPVTLQNSYNLVSRNADGDLAEALFREQMSLLSYSPLAAGMLTGKYRGNAQPANTRFTLFDNLGQRYRGPLVVEAIEAYAGLAERLGISLVELALGYVKSRWHVGATIIGATTLAQLRENIAAAQFELSAEALDGIAAIQARYPNPAG
jgi:aryl-alcohol dehydrogenase (NADP+)